MSRLHALLILSLLIIHPYLGVAGQKSVTTDWYAMQLTVSSAAPILEETQGNTADWQYEALQHAEELLFEAFIGSMNDLRIDAYRTAADILRGDYVRNRRLYEYFEDMKQSKVRYDNQEVIIEKTFSFFGENGFLYLLHEGGYDVGNFPVYRQFVHSTSFTGLVIDARGLGRVPAVAPRFFDDNHTLVYSPDVMYSDYFRKWGAVQYVNSPVDPLIQKRAGDNPYMIIAVPDEKLIETDIAISTEDARVLLQNKDSRESLMRGRVVVILDF